MFTFFYTSKLKTAAVSQSLKQPGFTERILLFTEGDYLKKIKPTIILLRQ